MPGSKPIFIIFSLCVLLSTGCKKENEAEKIIQSQLKVVHDQMEANAILIDAQGTVQQFMSVFSDLFIGGANGDTLKRSKSIDNCANVYVIQDQKKMIVDFGTDGCPGRHGRIRKGKWIVSYSNFWTNSGASFIIKFEDFSFTKPGQSQFFSVANGSFQTITTQKFDNGYFEFRKDFYLSSTLPSGEKRNHSGTHFITWDPQYSIFFFDDIVKINIFSIEFGTCRNGRNYEVVFENPLLYKASCFLENSFKPASGRARFSKMEKEIIAYYGGGVCNDSITVKVQGSKMYRLSQGE